MFTLTAPLFAFISSSELVVKDLKKCSTSSSFIFYAAVLTRVKDFLPKMKEAEEVLENELRVKSTCELDIESVGDDAPYIEMVRIILC